MDFQDTASVNLNDFFGGELPGYVTTWLGGSEDNSRWPPSLVKKDALDGGTA